MAETQSPSQIMYATYVHVGMRNRIQALVRADQWNGTDDPTMPIPLEDLAWAAATNPSIHMGVVARIVEGDVTTAVNEIVDGDLDYVVAQAMTRLAEIAAARRAAAAEADPAQP